jgi:hypothetical protein
LTHPKFVVYLRSIAVQELEVCEVRQYRKMTTVIFSCAINQLHNELLTGLESRHAMKCAYRPEAGSGMGTNQGLYEFRGNFEVRTRWEFSSHLLLYSGMEMAGAFASSERYDRRAYRFTHLENQERKHGKTQRQRQREGV